LICVSIAKYVPVTFVEKVSAHKFASYPDPNLAPLSRKTPALQISKSNSPISGIWLFGSLISNFTHVTFSSGACSFRDVAMHFQPFLDVHPKELYLFLDLHL
jgi:beta-lactamase regulating signal transducer with metallopeptidase domain